MNIIGQISARLYVYRFLIELLLCCSVTAVKLPRRKRFALRLIAALAVCALLSSYWTLELAQIGWVFVLRYLLLFGAVVFAIWFAFDCTPWAALFCGMCGYAMQHMVYKLNDIALTAFGGLSDALAAALHCALLLGELALHYQTFTRQIRASGFARLDKRENLLLTGAILLSTTILNAVYGTFAGQSPVPLQIVCSVYDCLCCVLSLWMLFKLLQVGQMQQEMEIIQQLRYREKKQMELSKENIDLINLKCHDMKHMLSRMRAQGGVATDGELRDLQQLVDIYDFTVDTGSDVLNLILAEKSLTCEKAGIQLNCIADGGKLDFMEDADIYSLMGNALDNAILAVQALPDPHKRVITLTIRPALGMLSICLENYYRGTLTFENGLPVTTQADTDYHGYGMKSMRYVVQKYRGEMTVRAESEIFTVSMLFPCS